MGRKDTGKTGQEMTLKTHMITSSHRECCRIICSVWVGVCASLVDKLSDVEET